MKISRTSLTNFLVYSGNEVYKTGVNRALTTLFYARHLVSKGPKINDDDSVIGHPLSSINIYVK